MEDNERCFDHAERIRSLETWIKVGTGVNLLGYIGIIFTILKAG